MVAGEQVGLVHDGDGETTGLASGDDLSVSGCGAAGAPGRDGPDLGIGQGLAGVDT
jgi:hypothetical protein